MTDATRTLEALLVELRREQITNKIQTRAVEAALKALNGRQPRAARAPGKRYTLSAARRQQISKRMKAVWAKKLKASK